MSNIQTKLMLMVESLSWERAKSPALSVPIKSRYPCVEQTPTWIPEAGSYNIELTLSLDLIVHWCKKEKKKNSSDSDLSLFSGW